MLYNTRGLHGYTIAARDGNVGHLEDVFFNERTWDVEFVVIDTGPWVFGRHLISSPNYIGTIDSDQSTVELNLTREEAKTRPERSEAPPVSELKEKKFNEFEKGPVFWSGSPERAGGKPAGVMPASDQEAYQEKQSVEAKLFGNHLRSANEIVDYRVEAEGGSVGRVTGVLVDPDQWIVRYVSVEDEREGETVRQIYSPDWIESIRWLEQAVHLNMTRARAIGAPPLTDDALVPREYEKKLYDYYELLG